MRIIVLSIYFTCHLYLANGALLAQNYADWADEQQLEGIHAAITEWRESQQPNCYALPLGMKCVYSGTAGNALVWKYKGERYATAYATDSTLWESTLVSEDTYEYWAEFVTGHPSGSPNVSVTPLDSAGQTALFVYPRIYHLWWFEKRWVAYAELQYLGNDAGLRKKAKEMAETLLQ